MALMAYSESEYNLVQSDRDCRGWAVIDEAGKHLGIVTEMLVNTDTDMVEFLLLDGGQRVPAGDVMLRDRRVIVRPPVDDKARLRRLQSERPSAHSLGPAAPEAFQEGSLEIRARGEEIVVSKQARVVEEIVVEKDVSERLEKVHGTLKRAEVEVERLGVRDKWVEPDQKS